MHTQFAESEFNYPADRIYPLNAILTAARIEELNDQDIKNGPVQFAFKRGPTSLTTIGRLNGFDSHVRQCYGLLGDFDSVEVVVCSYDKSNPFAQPGDSGAAIVGTNNDFVALLISGISDVTHGPPMEWLWNDIIKAKFPGATLFIDASAFN